MKSSTKHTCILIAIALFLLSAVMLYMSLSSPRVYVTSDMSTVSHLSYDDYTAPTTTPYSKVININTATVDQLTTISGIGEKTALQIISYRDEIGGYSSTSQIMNIKGISDKKFAKIAPYITV